MYSYTIIDVTPANIVQETLFCVKDIKNPGFACKNEWFVQRYEEGLRLKILKNSAGNKLAFIEYIPGEQAWRPVSAKDFIFIHCMFVYSNSDKNKGIGSLLLKACEEDAQAQGKAGLAVMTSNGAWTADKRLFIKNGFTQADKRGRFELMVKKFEPDTPEPKLFDWTLQQSNFSGWNLVYADQCPWHEKSVSALQATAREYGTELKIKKLYTAVEAQHAPSGFGVFSLLYNGELLEDHYLSQTRFRSILIKHLNQ